MRQAAIRLSVLLVLAILVAGCTTQFGKDRIYDVQSVVDARESIAEQRIVIDAFLTRYGNYYFLSDGTPNGAGKDGENYACRPGIKIWFPPSEMLSMTALPKVTISSGRRIIITGQIYNETLANVPENIGPWDASPESIKNWSAGPLRRVQLVRVKADRCF